MVQMLLAAMIAVPLVGGVFAIALYLFLQCVSDAEGLSFYSDERVCEELHFSLNGLWKAREALVDAGFLLYRRPIYQLLNLPSPLELAHESRHP